MPIPKIIHQTYKNYDLPEIYKFCQEKIKNLHPDFKYCFYTDLDIDQFIKTNFSEYYNKFNQLPRMIMKIDMFRYFLMYKFGGIYVDMDYLMVNNFDLLDYKLILPINREDSSGNPICLGNCIFASEPNHPFWKLLIDSLFNIDRTQIDFKNDKNIDNNKFGTGPLFVFDNWKNYSINNNDIHLCKKNLFHPPFNKRKNEDELKKKGSYGVHLCTGKWRKNQL